MRLYNLTVRRPDAINSVRTCRLDAASGSCECLIWARGTWIEAVRLTDSDTLELFAEYNCFSAVRSIAILGDDELLVALSSGDVCQLNWRSGRFESKTVLKEPSARLSAEYLVTDPQGRMAIALGIESTRKLFRPSVIDVSVPFTFCYAVQPLNAYNPEFVCLEAFKYQPKQLTCYELNLGLNSVLQLWSVSVPNDANFIVCSSAGVLVCTENEILLVSEGKVFDRIAEKLVVCAKITESLFLAQTNEATLLKVAVTAGSLEASRIDIDGTVSQFRELTVLESGFVFGASELGQEHQLLQIMDLKELSLSVVSSVVNSAPISASSVSSRHLNLALGYGQHAKCVESVRGIATDSLASTPLPFEPNAVFTGKRRAHDEYDGLILISTPSSTTTLAVSDEGAVEEVNDIGIASDVGTLCFAVLQHAYVQIHTYGLRYIKPGKETNSWQPSGGAQILAAACTPTQVVLALSNKQLVYFEEGTGELLESQQRAQLPTVASALCFKATPDLKSLDIYVALQDETVRRYRLPSFKQLQLISMPYTCSSVLELKDVVYVGHFNGAFSTCENDAVCTRALGSQPVRLTRLNNAVIALSSQSWYVTSKSIRSLISDKRLKMVQNFDTEDIHGLVAITGGSLEVLEVVLDTLNNDVVRELTTVGSTIRNILHVGQRQLIVAKSELKWADNGAALSLEGIKCAAVVNASKPLLAVCHGSKIAIVDLDLHVIHETPVGNCTALAPLGDQLMAAVDQNILVYNMGKKQLLYQEGISVPNSHVIRALRASRNCIFVADSRSSVTVLKRDSAGLRVVCSDPIQRGVTRMLVLDPMTVCIGDQFGNISVLRIADESFELIAHHAIADAVVSLHRGTLTPVSSLEGIVYVGVQGTVGVLLPFISQAETEQFEQLEQQIRRNSGIPRGGLEPPKNVIDGDVCELFPALQAEAQTEIAEILEKSPQEIANELELLKGRVA